MKSITIPTNFGINLHFEIPSIGKRIGAFLIDWAIKGGYLLLLINLPHFPTYISLILYIPVIFYTLLLETINKGQTVGKMAMKIRVVGQNGSIPTFTQCAIRWMFLFVDCWLFILLTFINSAFFLLVMFSPLVGLIFALRNKNQQRIGDLAANTLLINATEEEFTLSETIYGYLSFEKHYKPMFPEIMKLPDHDINRIQTIMERATETYNHDLAEKLSDRIKTVLKIQTKLDNYSFLKQLLKDYNYFSINQK